jgi:HK97 family phage portal protein
VAGHPAKKRTPAPKKSRGESYRLTAVRAALTDPNHVWASLSQAVNPETAATVTNIFAVCRFLSQAIGVCPVHTMQEGADGRKSHVSLPCSYTLRKRPNPSMTGFAFYGLMAYWTALHGVGFSRIRSGSRGWMTTLEPMHPARVVVKVLPGFTRSYVYQDPFTGKTETLEQSEVLHWNWVSNDGVIGIKPGRIMASSIRLARQLDVAAVEFWRNSARPDMVLETDEKIPDAAAQQLLADLAAAYGGAENRGRAALLPRKTRIKTIESNSMEASQYQELRESMLPEVCRHWGVPSTLLGDHKMAKYSNAEQEHLSAQVWCLLPWSHRMAEPLNMALQDVYGEDVYAKFDMRGLLRGDDASRAALYQALWNMGALKPNEIRDLEDMDLLDDPAADLTYVQQGFAPLGTNATPAITTGGSTNGQ